VLVFHDGLLLINSLGDFIENNGSRRWQSKSDTPWRQKPETF
jgi:hypothetical protein